jgi:YVTN family beta-propeller protein
VAVTPDSRVAYVMNLFTSDVSAIDTEGNTVIATIPVTLGGGGVAVSPDGSKVYVGHSVIDTVSNTVIATIPSSGFFPNSVAISPDGSRLYIAESVGGKFRQGVVSVIDTASNKVTATIFFGLSDLVLSVAVTPDGSRVWVLTTISGVSVIDAVSNKVTTTIPVGKGPRGLAITSDGTRVYVANEFDDTVSLIDTASNVVTTNIPVGHGPVALAIQPALAIKFAGTPGKANCHGKSVSALARQYHGMNNAAASLGFSSVRALQNAIDAFCGG